MQQRDERVVAHRTVEIELRGACTDPIARSFTGAEVVLLRAVRDRVEVIPLLTRSELPNRQHTLSKRVEAPRTRHARIN